MSSLNDIKNKQNENNNNKNANFIYFENIFC